MEICERTLSLSHKRAHTHSYKWTILNDSPGKGNASERNRTKERREESSVCMIGEKLLKAMGERFDKRKTCTHTHTRAVYNAPYIIIRVFDVMLVHFFLWFCFLFLILDFGFGFGFQRHIQSYALINPDIYKTPCTHAQIEQCCCTCAVQMCVQLRDYHICVFLFFFSHFSISFYYYFSSLLLSLSTIHNSLLFVSRSCCRCLSVCVCFHKMKLTAIHWMKKQNESENSKK